MFYVVETSTVNGAVAKAVTTKANLTEAAMVFHQTMASMMANGNVREGFCTVLEQNGSQIYELTAYYVNPEAPSEE